MILNDILRSDCIMSGYDVISQIFEFTIYKKDLDESISNKEKIIDIVN